MRGALEPDTSAPARPVEGRGFTLIELAITLAIITVLATLAYGIERAVTRNVDLGGATFELASKMQGLRTDAMAVGQDHLLVVLNAPGDASDCGTFAASRCTRWWVLKNPAAAWVIDSFDPANPGNNAEYVTSDQLPRGVTLLAAGPAAVPAPFTGMPTADAQLTTTCGGATCFAVRFGADGRVRGEFRNGVAATTKSGYLFALGNPSLAAGSGAAAQRAVLIAFPVGLVKTFAF